MISELQALRHEYQPKRPKVFENGAALTVTPSKKKNGTVLPDVAALLPFSKDLTLQDVSDHKLDIENTLRVGVILSGGQAPGGHNVIAGLFDALKDLNKDNTLLGFSGGPSGLLEKKYIELDENRISEYRNTGGFDMIGSGRTKLESYEQFEKSRAILEEMGVNGLVIIGGDDSNTNAAMLAEHLLSKKSSIKVVGCPKTIDGDLKNSYIETSFGFDTATKVYSELIGNIARDADSARKYWHFIKVMGRSASHIALECGLATRANITLVSEEVEQKKMTLAQVISYIGDRVIARADRGLNYGLVVIPEGIIEFVPEMKSLISELNDILSHHQEEWQMVSSSETKFEWLRKHLDSESAHVLFSLPRHIADQLVLDRDPHGNVQVSRIETEKLLIEMTAEYIDRVRSDVKFSALNHFFGYEGRCAAPSNFDSDYGYGLGFTAAILLANGKSGYMAALTNLSEDADHWIPMGIPIVSMMNLEKRHGEMKPVIRKALVDLDGAPMKELMKNRPEWEADTCYIYPGPIQYFGPASISDTKTITLILENEKGE